MIEDAPPALLYAVKVAGNLDMDVSQRKYAVSVAVIDFFLPEISDRLFADLDAAGLDDQVVLVRTDGIARSLFNLRNDPGFREICARFKGRDHRSVLFEATAAATLKGAGFQIDARPSTQVKTLDFDLEVGVGEETMAVEVTELNSTEFNPNGLRHTLNYKRGQLPADRPAALYCYYPSEWVNQVPSLEDELGTVAKRFFGGTGRVNHLWFVHERYIPKHNGFTYALMSLRFENTNARHHSDAISQVARRATCDIVEGEPVEDHRRGAGEFQHLLDFALGG